VPNIAKPLELPERVNTRFRLERTCVDAYAREPTLEIWNSLEAREAPRDRAAYLNVRWWSREGPRLHLFRLPFRIATLSPAAIARFYQAGARSPVLRSTDLPAAGHSSDLIGKLGRAWVPKQIGWAPPRLYRAMATNIFGGSTQTAAAVGRSPSASRFCARKTQAARRFVESRLGLSLRTVSKSGPLYIFSACP
jgi:hypothetical protein